MNGLAPSRPHSIPECQGPPGLFHRLVLLALAAAAGLMVASGCTTDGTEPLPADGMPPSLFEYPVCKIDEPEVERILSHMTLRQKVAQMYIVGVSLLPWDLEQTRRLVERIEVGGVFLQPIRGIAPEPADTAANTNRLQEMALSRDLPVPLLVVADQEGGIPQALSRLTGGTDQPGNLGLGATFQPACTHRSYGIMGEQLSAVGINVDFAPVLGLMISYEESSMYTRCFGELSSEVTAHAPQAVRGLQENRVVACVKHFPSHSTAPGDEHFTLPANREDEETVRTRYLPPFVAAIRAGTDMIMTTHAVYTAWDDVPVTFSRSVVTGLLREELGYRGLIVTDDMNMGALTLTDWDEHPDVLAIRAGTDLLLDVAADDAPMFGVSPGNEQYAYDLEGQIEAVLAALGDGRLSPEQIDASVRRILRAKMRHCLFRSPLVDEDAVPEHVDTPEQREDSRRLHERAVTLVRNDAGLWPLDIEAHPRVHVVCPGAILSRMYPDAGWGTAAGTDLLREVRRLLPSATGDTFDVDPLPLRVPALLDRVRAAAPDVLVVGTYHALYHEAQRDLVLRLLEMGLPTIVVSLALPYDLMAFPEASTFLAVYSNRDLALETAARVLLGEATPGGRLPVSLPGLYATGWSALP